MAYQVDPFKQYLKITAALDPLKSYREMTAALDPLKSCREMTAALDPLKQYREMTDRLTRGAILSSTRGVKTAVSEPFDEILTSFEAILEEDASALEEPVSRWLTQLPPLAQRRLCLLALAALWAITDALDSFAVVNPPIHLDKVVAALLAIAACLNEQLGEPPTGDS
jgi:hypothetical protein